jgi:hypothetical protein
MKRFLIFWLHIALVCEAQSEPFTPEQSSPEEMAAKLGIRLPPRPWHMADVWYGFQQPTPNFEKLEVEVTIDRDVPDTYNLYVAPIGIARINGIDFYGGLQTNVNGWATKKSRTRVHPGMGAIFSRWAKDKKTPLSLDNVRTVKSGLCESAGYEGSFCSVRRPFKWGKGSYVYSIEKGKKEGEKTWFDCRVRVKETGKTIDVGGLLFEGTTFSFWASHAAFVEIYATSKIPRSGIPKVKVTFGYPLINGIKPKLRYASAYHPTTGSAGSPSCAKARAQGDKVVVEVGPIFRRPSSGNRYSLKLKP